MRVFEVAMFWIQSSESLVFPRSCSAHQALLINSGRRAMDWGFIAERFTHRSHNHRVHPSSLSPLSASKDLIPPRVSEASITPLELQRLKRRRSKTGYSVSMNAPIPSAFAGRVEISLIRPLGFYRDAISQIAGGGESLVIIMERLLRSNNLSH